MRAVLGIDAAWTLAQPSGVALAAETIDGWRLIAVASSYQHFDALADDRLTREARPRGSMPDARALLTSATRLCGRPVDLVAIDMPLAHVPITCRRASDNAVSRTYGARKLGTPTPSAARPGPISDALREGFKLSGYPLLTSAVSPPGVIEVYPHPAPGGARTLTVQAPLQGVEGPELLAVRRRSRAASPAAAGVGYERSAARPGDRGRQGGDADARRPADRNRAEGVRGRARRDRLRLGRDLCAGGTSRAVRRRRVGDLDSASTRDY